MLTSAGFKNILVKVFYEQIECFYMSFLRLREE